MHNMVKFGIIVASLFLVISCSDDFPSAPEFKFCKFEERCESIHKISKGDCNEIGGTIVDTCEEPSSSSGSEEPLFP
ncbi:MAG: hypothetical protein LBQ76_06545 [Candidatus Fibromonas sp.]|jgi:hypothetical protein|nr:hypothetical protein [Candidatus Fibromonas sp.]